MLNTLLIANISGSTAMLIILGLVALAVILGTIVRYIEKKEEEEEEDCKDDILENTIPVGDGLKANSDNTAIKDSTVNAPDVAAQPAPSCLALGIAKSILETPEYWVTNELMADIPTNVLHGSYFNIKLNVKHHVIGTVVISGGTNMYTGVLGNTLDVRGLLSWVVVNDEFLTPIDAKPIIEAIEKNPIGQYKYFLDAEAKKKGIADLTQSYFSHLGCPPLDPKP